MLSVKLVRSVVLGENINATQFNYDGDNENETDDHLLKNTKIHKTKKKLPMLLFTPTQELISDTFRLATLARLIGLDFHPSPSLSHLLFSWPHPPSTSPSYTHPRHHHVPSTSSSPFTPSPTNHNNQLNRISVSSSTSASTSASTSVSALPAYDAVPIPFPCLTTATSLSLLRCFVSMSRGFFKLVFIYPTEAYPNPDYDCCSDLCLFTRVSGRKVRDMEEFSRELAGNGWALFRTGEKEKRGMYLFRKMEAGRGRVRSKEGEGRVRELRLPGLEFEKGVSFRVLLYILLMTDHVFYLA